MFDLLSFSADILNKIFTYIKNDINKFQKLISNKYINVNFDLLIINEIKSSNFLNNMIKKQILKNIIKPFLVNIEKLFIEYDDIDIEFYVKNLIKYNKTSIYGEIIIFDTKTLNILVEHIKNIKFFKKWAQEDDDYDKELVENHSNIHKKLLNFTIKSCSCKIFTMIDYINIIIKKYNFVEDK